jgi:hypothetical protein
MICGCMIVCMYDLRERSCVLVKLAKTEGYAAGFYEGRTQVMISGHGGLCHH